MHSSMDSIKPKNARKKIKSFQHYLQISMRRDAAKTHDLPFTIYIFKNSKSLQFTSLQCALSASNAVRFQGDTHLLLASNSIYINIFKYRAHQLKILLTGHRRSLPRIFSRFTQRAPLNTLKAFTLLQGLATQLMKVVCILYTMVNIKYFEFGKT